MEKGTSEQQYEGSVGRSGLTISIVIMVVALAVTAKAEAPSDGFRHVHQKRVHLKAVSVPVASPDPQTRLHSAVSLRSALIRELRGLRSLEVVTSAGADVIVRANLKRFVSRETPEGHAVECEVALVVLGAERQEMRMVLSGKARVLGGTSPEIGALRQLQKTAIESAVNGAIKPLRRPNAAIAARLTR